MRKVILATQSNARKSLFDSLGISYDAVPANIDEKAIRDTNLLLRAQKIANAKANKISVLYPNAVIIACDTFSSQNGRTFEKPVSKDEAKEMLYDSFRKKCHKLHSL